MRCAHQTLCSPDDLWGRDGRIFSSWYISKGLHSKSDCVFAEWLSVRNWSSTACLTRRRRWRVSLLRDWNGGTRMNSNIGAHMNQNPGTHMNWKFKYTHELQCRHTHKSEFKYTHELHAWKAVQVHTCIRIQVHAQIGIDVHTCIGVQAHTTHDRDIAKGAELGLRSSWSPRQYSSEPHLRREWSYWQIDVANDWSVGSSGTQQTTAKSQYGLPGSLCSRVLLINQHCDLFLGVILLDLAGI